MFGLTPLVGAVYLVLWPGPGADETQLTKIVWPERATMREAFDDLSDCSMMRSNARKNSGLYGTCVLPEIYTGGTRSRISLGRKGVTWSYDPNVHVMFNVMPDSVVILSRIDGQATQPYYWENSE